jgi:peroxiredoxin
MLLFEDMSLTTRQNRSRQWLDRKALTLAITILLAGALPAQETSKRGMKAAEAGLPPDAHELQIGDAAPDFSLQCVDGKFYTLADFKPARVLMVIFLSNHCPYSHAMEGRLAQLLEETKGRGLMVVAINPNHAEAIRIDELGYSKYGDSFEQMKQYAKERRFKFPYLYDGEKQVVAKAYGCLATPHVFLFDQQRRLRYQGRFDDSRFPEPASVTSPDARNAVEALLAGRSVPVAVTRVMGCSTKWASKAQEVAQAEAQWNSTPVEVEEINASGVAALARNDSKKLRLFNVWATWCAPCVKEFPGLVSLARRLGNRDFELITLSVDDPKDAAKVKRFLEQQHVALPNRVRRSVGREGRRTNNYLFTGANTEALLKALDPQAPGPVPHTVVIAPGGKVLYRHAGELDPSELQAKVLEVLGPYYESN